MKLMKLLLSLVLVLTMILIDIDYIGAKQKSSREIAKEYESTLLPEQPQPKEPDISTATLPKRGANLPLKYSSVEKGYVTDAKNQGKYGTCWAFSACSAAETSLIKKGLATKDNIDLSESHLAYYLYHTYSDKYNNTKGDKTIALSSFEENGGNHAVTVHAIDNFGFAKESLYPYNQLLNMSKSASQSKQYDTSYILKNAYSVNFNDRLSIKQAIVQYGSVATMYYSDEKCYYDIDNHTSYYNPKNLAVINHAVTIVGWDDQFSQNNFKNKPLHDGAWLVKNSWGKAFGEDGYFWMSYDETSLSQAYVYDCDKKMSQDIYQYDGSAASSYLYIQDTMTLANVYKVQNTNTQKSQQLDSVLFGTEDNDLSYTIKVYGHLTNIKNPTSGVLLTSQTGKTSYAGVYNIPLKNKVYLGNNTSYSIVVTLRSNQKDEVSFLIDMTLKLKWIEFINNTNNENSYIKNDYTNQWEKLTDMTARIKGYASINNDKKNIYATTFSVPTCTYTGQKIEPFIKIKDGDRLLLKGKDYTIAYYKNINVGTGYAIVQGIDEYSGTKRIDFKINQATYQPTVKGYSGTYDGKSHTIAISGVKSGSTIKYRTSTKNSWTTKKPTRTSVGTTTVYYQITNPNYNTITGSQKIIINKRSISTLTYSKLGNKTYTGKQIKYAPTVKYGSKTLKNGTDYTLSYGKNKSTGKATVKIIGKGNYSGSITKTFYIVPKTPTSLKVISGKKTAKVSYKKSTGASGYQIAYSTKKISGYQYVTTPSLSKTISKLTSKKMYYIKIRAYKIVGKTKYYGSYSSIKSIKVK